MCLTTTGRNGSQSARPSSNTMRGCHGETLKKPRKPLWTQPAALRLTLVGKTIFPSMLQSKAPHTSRRRIMSFRSIRLRDVLLLPILGLPKIVRTAQQKHTQSPRLGRARLISNPRKF